MLEEIDEKLKKEIKKILAKEDVSIEEIKFVSYERDRLETINAREKMEAESKKRMEELTKSMMNFTLNP